MLEKVWVHPLVVARSREVKRMNRGKTDALDVRLIAELCKGFISSCLQFWIISLSRLVPIVKIELCDRL